MQQPSAGARHAPLTVLRVRDEAGQYFLSGRQGQHRFFREWVTGKGTLDEDQWAWEEPSSADEVLP